MPKAEDAIRDINSVLTQIVPMIGLVSATGTAIVAIFRALGRSDEAASFEIELNKFRTARTDLQNSINEFNSKYNN